LPSGTTHNLSQSILKDTMPTSTSSSHFFVNTDLKWYKRHHPSAVVDNPIHFWLREGYAYLTPKPVPGTPPGDGVQQDMHNAYADHLRQMKKGDVIYAYESMTGAGYVAAGIVQESWDEQEHAGRAELFRDGHELYYRIRVAWDAGFHCSLKDLRASGFSHPIPAIGAIRDRERIAFLSGRRR